MTMMQWCSGDCDGVMNVMQWRLWWSDECDAVETVLEWWMWCSGDCDAVITVMQYLLWCSYYCDAVITVMRWLLWCSDYCDAEITVMQLWPLTNDHDAVETVETKKIKSHNEHGITYTSPCLFSYYSTANLALLTLTMKLLSFDHCSSFFNADDTFSILKWIWVYFCHYPINSISHN